MAQTLPKQLDSETDHACNTLLRTIHELLGTDSMLKKLVGVSTTEELYFFCAVIAHQRLVGAERMEGCGSKMRSFEEFIECCIPARAEALLLLSENALEFKNKRRKPHFFRCRRPGGTYS